MCLAISNNLFLMLQDAPKCISSTNSRSGQPKNDAKTLFSHHPSPFHSNFYNCNSIGICTALRFQVQLPLSEIGPEVCCDLLRLLAQKITKHVHSSKPASLNHPIAMHASPTARKVSIVLSDICLPSPFTRFSKIVSPYFFNKQTKNVEKISGQ